ncbi:hypothetical protein H5410_006659 [Solanum commersonii]|uniref:TF-B3 domain-containing protein n=1 Tax=Solanum commersonii TaxID=4109 RepID=A0A9J6AAE0_SOLCO|nr:hypothetical protein H5410_006659 [Solanum commersonii]
MLIDSNNPPAFCKLLQSGEVFLSKMQMPSCFIKENKKMLSKDCLLKTDEAGMSWEAKIVREKSNNYFICEGEWPLFVVHHQLKQGDVLLFFLVEKSVFRVQPYTQICCRNIGEKKLFYEELSSNSSPEEEIEPSKRARKVDSTEEDTSSSDEDDPPYSHRATYYKNPKQENVSSEKVLSDDSSKKFRGCSSTTSVMNFKTDHPYYEMVVKRSHTTFMLHFLHTLICTLIRLFQRDSRKGPA